MTGLTGTTTTNSTTTAPKLTTQPLAIAPTTSPATLAPSATGLPSSNPTPNATTANTTIAAATPTTPAAPTVAPTISPTYALSPTGQTVLANAQNELSGLQGQAQAMANAITTAGANAPPNLFTQLSLVESQIAQLNQIISAYNSAATTSAEANADSLAYQFNVANGSGFNLGATLPVATTTSTLTPTVYQEPTAPTVPTPTTNPTLTSTGTEDLETVTSVPLNATLETTASGAPTAQANAVYYAPSGAPTYYYIPTVNPTPLAPTPTTPAPISANSAPAVATQPTGQGTNQSPYNSTTYIAPGEYISTTGTPSYISNQQQFNQQQQLGYIPTYAGQLAPQNAYTITFSQPVSGFSLSENAQGVTATALPNTSNNAPIFSGAGTYSFYMGTPPSQSAFSSNSGSFTSGNPNAVLTPSGEVITQPAPTPISTQDITTAAEFDAAIANLEASGGGYYVYTPAPIVKPSLTPFETEVERLAREATTAKTEAEFSQVPTIAEVAAQAVPPLSVNPTEKTGTTSTTVPNSVLPSGANQSSSAYGVSQFLNSNQLQPTIPVAHQQTPQIQPTQANNQANNLEGYANANILGTPITSNNPPLQLQGLSANASNAYYAPTTYLTATNNKLYGSNPSAVGAIYQQYVPLTQGGNQNILANLKTDLLDAINNAQYAASQIGGQSAIALELSPPEAAALTTLLSVPTATAQIITNPIGVAQGYANLPSEFVQNPLSTTASVETGALAGLGLGELSDVVPKGISDTYANLAGTPTTAESAAAQAGNLAQGQQGASIVNQNYVLQPASTPETTGTTAAIQTNPSSYDILVNQGGEPATYNPAAQAAQEAGQPFARYTTNPNYQVTYGTSPTSPFTFAINTGTLGEQSTTSLPLNQQEAAYTGALYQVGDKLYYPEAASPGTPALTGTTAYAPQTINYPTTESNIEGYAVKAYPAKVSTIGGSQFITSTEIQTPVQVTQNGEYGIMNPTGTGTATTTIYLLKYDALGNPVVTELGTTTQAVPQGTVYPNTYTGGVTALGYPPLPSTIPVSAETTPTPVTQTMETTPITPTLSQITRPYEINVATPTVTGAEYLGTQGYIPSAQQLALSQSIQPELTSAFYQATEPSSAFYQPQSVPPEGTPEVLTAYDQNGNPIATKTVGINLNPEASPTVTYSRPLTFENPTGALSEINPNEVMVLNKGVNVPGGTEYTGQVTYPSGETSEITSTQYTEMMNPPAPTSVVDTTAGQSYLQRLYDLQTGKTTLAPLENAPVTETPEVATSESSSLPNAEGTQTAPLTETFATAAPQLAQAIVPAQPVLYNAPTPLYPITDPTVLAALGISENIQSPIGLQSITPTTSPVVLTAPTAQTVGVKPNFEQAQGVDIQSLGATLPLGQAQVGLNNPTAQTGIATSGQTITPVGLDYSYTVPPVYGSPLSATGIPAYQFEQGILNQQLNNPYQSVLNNTILNQADINGQLNQQLNEQLNGQLNEQENPQLNELLNQQVQQQIPLQQQIQQQVPTTTVPTDVPVTVIPPEEPPNNTNTIINSAKTNQKKKRKI